MTDNKKTPNEAKSNLRKLSRKRWFYPAVYLCVAALVMASVLWIEKGSNNQAGDKGKDHNIALEHKGQDAVPVNSMKEEFKWPVANKDNVEVVQGFYDATASAEDQQAALVNYDNTYTQNTGINIAAKDGKAFDVTASMSGTVLKAEKDDLLGNIVELQHKNGVTTLYESLATVAVEPGQEVQQGDIIGKAGADKFNKDAGIHVHFEIRKDGIPVDPIAYFSKGISSLKDVKSESNNTSKTSGDKATDQSKQDTKSNDQDRNNTDSNMKQNNNSDQQSGNGQMDEEQNGTPSQDNTDSNASNPSDENQVDDSGVNS